MGLFWSMEPEKSAKRFIIKDVTVPYVVNIRVFDGVHEKGSSPKFPLANTSVERMFMDKGVCRVPIKVGRITGTVFIPEGQGPFPAVMDTYGVLVALTEARAALLASHGYVTFAMSYLYGEGLAKSVIRTSVKHFKAAFDWLRAQDYVDENRMGLLGLSLGGWMSLQLASLVPEVKAVVSINAYPVFPTQMAVDSVKFGEHQWPNATLVYKTDEGVVLKDAFRMENPYLIPVWHHGAKILLISGGDDLQIYPGLHHWTVQNWPSEYKSNIQSFFYPGAGHIIEFPYMPFIRRTKPGRSRMLTMDFVPEAFLDEYLMIGGYTQQHTHAEEDAWQRILHFLAMSLGRLQ